MLGKKKKPEGFVPAIANTIRESEFWLVAISELLHQACLLCVSGTKL